MTNPHEHDHVTRLLELANQAGTRPVAMTTTRTLDAMRHVSDRRAATVEATTPPTNHPRSTT